MHRDPSTYTKQLRDSGDRTTKSIAKQLRESGCGLIAIDAEKALEALADALADALDALPLDENDSGQLSFHDGQIWRCADHHMATAHDVITAHPLAAHVMRAVVIGEGARADWMRDSLPNTRIRRDGSVVVADNRL